MKKIELVEIARSFSMKKNLGNYESVDFFASQKAEVPVDIAEETSMQLYEFCKKECVKSYNAYLKEKAELDNFNDPNYYQEAEKKAMSKFPKTYAAKPTDSWRGDTSAKYTAVGGTRENPMKIEITDEFLQNNTSEPQ